MEDMISPTDPDVNLVQRIVRKDTEALSSLYDRYSRLVFSVALKILSSQEAAEEVTQDVFVQVWHKADTYNVYQGKLVTWITSIARNRAIDQYRRSNVRPEGNSISWDDCCDDHSDDADGVENNIIDGHQRHMLQEAIQGLPEDQRQALSLAFFRGMTHQEIALELDQTLGTVKTRIRLALLKLRSLISGDL
jgi:RNA polymerase sigma-70 factor (ECF subfamily)